MIFLAKNIKQIRLKKGLSQEQFAEDLNVSRSRISSYEENRALPPIAFIVTLCDYACISMDVLLKKKIE